MIYSTALLEWLSCKTKTCRDITSHTFFDKETDEIKVQAEILFFETKFCKDVCLYILTFIVSKNY